MKIVCIAGDEMMDSFVYFVFQLKIFWYQKFVALCRNSFMEIS